MKIGWVRTYTGIHFNVQAPEPDMVDVRDLAHHLSLECRWSGATTRHYSVAEHSLWVAKFVRKMVPAEHRELACIHAMLHDAHEAYVKDLPTPVKVLWGQPYVDMCARIDGAIRLKLNLQPPSQGIVDAIKLADRYSAWAEAKALVRPCKGIKREAGIEPPIILRQDLQMEYELKRAQTPENVENAYLSYINFLVSA